MTDGHEFEFSDGVLHIASPLQKLRIRFGSEPKAEAQDTRGRWRETWPDFRLLVPESDASAHVSAAVVCKREAFMAFRATVPDELALTAEPFPSHQWTLLLFMRNSKTALDLAVSNPVLAYAMANSGEILGKPAGIGLEQALRRGRHRQKQICEWLGYPGDLAMVRVFRKLRPEAVSPPLLRMLRNAMRRDSDRTRKLLGHCREVNAAMLTFIVYRELADLATPALLSELREAGSGALALADSLLHAQRLREDMGSEARTRAFDSTRQIAGFVDATDRAWLEHRRRLEAEAEAREAAEAEARRRQRLQNREAERARGPRPKTLKPGDCEWPLPPVPGTADIVPITSYKMLGEESKAQHNCIRSYWRDIAGERRCMYAYRVLKPERATLMLVRSGCDWRLSELKGAHNRQVSDTTRHVVLDWLEARTLAAVAADGG